MTCVSSLLLALVLVSVLALISTMLPLLLSWPEHLQYLDDRLRERRRVTEDFEGLSTDAVFVML